MNVDILANSTPSIGIFFGAALAVSALTFATAAGYTPLMLIIRKRISHYERRWAFRSYLRLLKRQAKSSRNTEEVDLLTTALQEKKESFHALTYILKNRQAESRLQDQIESEQR
jgi:hypothetical protein